MPLTRIARILTRPPKHGRASSAKTAPQEARCCAATSTDLRVVKINQAEEGS